MKKSQLTFTRMSGAKNTFFIVDCTGEQSLQTWLKLSLSDKEKMAKKLCLGFDDNHTDGLIFLVPNQKASETTDFAWQFFNADGSHADMCGNAARCVTLFAGNKMISEKKQMTFSTGAGPVVGEIVGKNLVCVQMPEIKQLEKTTVENISGFLLDTGVPHFVIQQSADFHLGQKLRHSRSLAPAGANVTFVENVDLQKMSLDAVTYERGVEDMTAACGTGAVAAAAWLLTQTADKNKTVDVRMPGGFLMIQNAIVGQRPLLTGEAHFEYELTEILID